MFPMTFYCGKDNVNRRFLMLRALQSQFSVLLSFPSDRGSSRKQKEALIEDPVTVSMSRGTNSKYRH